MRQSSHPKPPTDCFVPQNSLSSLPALDPLVQKCVFSLLSRLLRSFCNGRMAWVSAQWMAWVSA
jgi:hypothetical protein